MSLLAEAAPNWTAIGVIVSSVALLIYPPIGLMWRWIKHTEDRFDELQIGINELRSNDSLDVQELKAFKADVGRRLERLEEKVWS